MRLIPLSKGQFAQVDDADFDHLSQWKWCASKAARGFYAMRATSAASGQKPRFIYMHRQVNETPAGLFTDHVDGDTLNNQRANLRTATPRQNAMNTRAHHDGASRFKGVARNNKWVVGGANPWVAHIQARHIGVFPTEEAAAAAYAAEARRLYGDFNPLNIKAFAP